MGVRRKYIRSIVEHLLDKHDIKKAPVDVERLALLLGANVQYAPTEEKLSGFILKDIQNNQVIIGINENHHKNRQRFTIAHELGHLYLHEKGKIHIDRKFQINLRDENSSTGDSEEEKEANLFAAELLMPAKFISKDLTDIEAFDLFDDDYLEKLADTYQVSRQALTFRLSYLNYIQL
jgi:Zn-dependent peptidase ImmA (M78 family)